jgi:hypothetical protein
VGGVQVLRAPARLGTGCPSPRIGGVPGALCGDGPAGGSARTIAGTFPRLSSLWGANTDRPTVQPAISAYGGSLPRGAAAHFRGARPRLAVRGDASPCRTRNSEPQVGNADQEPAERNAHSTSPPDPFSADGARVRHEPWRRGGTRSWTPWEYPPLPLRDACEARMSAAAGGGARGEGWTITRCSSAACQSCAPALAYTARRYMRWVL